MTSNSTHENVLVYAPSWIGDAVMSLGALRVLRQHHATARLTVLARSWVRDLYEQMDSVDATIEYDPRGEHRGIGGFLNVAERVRRERFDACLLLPNAFRAAAFARVARIPERWGYGTEGRGFLLTKAVAPAPRPFGRHQAYYYVELVSALGFESEGEPKLDLRVSEETAERASRRLHEAGWRGGPLVGVHPGATNSRAKIWPPARFAEAAEKLADAREAEVVVLGGPSEAALAAEVRAGLGDRAIALDGKTTLGELMGVLSRLSVLLTNDSGPMHLAAALGTPTVAVFGPTDPRETGPFSAAASVVREPVACSPCNFRDCPIDHRCMQQVATSRVVAEAEALCS